jgi:hypothetical protein
MREGALLIVFISLVAIAYSYAPNEGHCHTIDNTFSCNASVHEKIFRKKIEFTTNLTATLDVPSQGLHVVILVDGKPKFDQLIKIDQLHIPICFPTLGVQLCAKFTDLKANIEKECLKGNAYMVVKVFGKEFEIYGPEPFSWHGDRC